MKNRISELKNIYQGRPVAVLGGGPSLPDDINQLPAGTILISVNGHSLKLRGADYIVFCDNPYRKRRLLLENTIKTYYGPKISPIDEFSDYVFDVPYWDGGFTSTVATWLACYMGADPVLLCGMDCYGGEEKYFFDDWRETKEYHPCYEYPLENHLNAWRPAFDFVERVHVIKTVSGPLADVFGRWKVK